VGDCSLAARTPSRQTNFEFLCSIHNGPSIQRNPNDGFQGCNGRSSHCPTYAEIWRRRPCELARGHWFNFVGRSGRSLRALTLLAQVERAFRSMKTVDLHVRPIYHFSESRVRAHVFLCMLAYYVEWHLREALKPLLHDDEDLATRRDQRPNPGMPTPRFEGASAKAARHRTDDALPVHSLHTLLQDLATLTYNITSTPVNPQAKIVIATRPTPLQSKAFALLGIDPVCSQ